jgi:hypothetical protein
MMIDMNGPDIETVDEVKSLILESVNVWKNYKKRGPSRGSHLKGPVRTEAPTRRGMFTLNSRDLRMVFNDFIKDDFIPEGDGQVTSGNTGCIPS